MKLKSCPWGHKAEIRSDSTVFCSQDGCEMQLTYMSPEVWNNRPGEKAARAEVLDLLREWIDVQEPAESYDDRLVRTKKVLDEN